MASGARRYAQAVFELAQEEGNLEAWSERLAGLRSGLDHPEIRNVLDNPAIALERRQSAAAGVVEGSGREAQNLARLLVAAGRVDDLDRIISEFERLADEAAGRMRAQATTAVELSSTETEKLVADLSRRLGRDVRLTVRVDPAIIGGLILRVGDRVIDASIATRLQQLRRRLAGA